MGAGPRHPLRGCWTRPQCVSIARLQVGRQRTASTRVARHAASARPTGDNRYTRADCRGRPTVRTLLRRLPWRRDLRRSALIADGKAWASVVHDGALRDQGMVGFAKVLSPEQIESIRHYVIKRANEDKALGDK